MNSMWDLIIPIVTVLGSMIFTTALIGFIKEILLDRMLDATRPPSEPRAQILTEQGWVDVHDN